MLILIHVDLEHVDSNLYDSDPYRFRLRILISILSYFTRIKKKSIS